MMKGYFVLAPLALLLSGVELSSVSAAEEARAPLLTLPIQRDKHWVVQGRTGDGKDVRLLLDTGASISVLNNSGPFTGAPITPEAEARFLKEGTLDWPMQNKVLGETTSSDIELQLGIAPAISIQGWTIPGEQLAVRHDLSPVEQASTEDSFDGVLGLESMARLTWRADYVAGVLTAYDQAPPAREWQQCVFMTLSLPPTYPVLRMTLGETLVPVIIDTGANDELSISDEDYDALKQAKMFVGTGLNYGLGASNQYVVNEHGILPGLHIGQQPLPRLQVQAGAPTARLGLGTLSKLDRFEMDFRHHRFCFDSAASPQDSKVSTVGAVLLRDGDAYVVKAVSPKGILGMSGLKVGDRLVSVGEVRTDTLKQRALYDALDATESQDVTVLRANRTLQVKLKRAHATK